MFLFFQLTTHEELKDEWLELMITDGLAIIMGRLQGQPSDEGTVVAMANLLTQLAKYFEMAVLILDHCMYYIMAAWKSYNVLKVSILGSLSNRQTSSHCKLVQKRACENLNAAQKWWVWGVCVWYAWCLHVDIKWVYFHMQVNKLLIKIMVLIKPYTNRLFYQIFVIISVN